MTAILDIASPAPCRPWDSWRGCTCPSHRDIAEKNRLGDVVNYVVRYHSKVLEWCEGADQDPAEARDPSLEDIDHWLRENTGYGHEYAVDAVDVARFAADDSAAPCCDGVMHCSCAGCDPSPVPGYQSLPVVTGRMLEHRDIIRWHIADTVASPVDWMEEIIQRIDAYLAATHGLDESQRVALSALLDDGALSFDECVRALRLVSTPA